MLFVRSFVAVYIQCTCNLKVIDIFFRTGLTISIILEVLQPGFVWELTVCFFYRLMPVIFPPNDYPKNVTDWSDIINDLLLEFEWKVD